VLVVWKGQRSNEGRISTERQAEGKHCLAQDEFTNKSFQGHEENDSEKKVNKTNHFKQKFSHKIMNGIEKL
jgi:hypothetical protein